MRRAGFTGSVHREGNEVLSKGRIDRLNSNGACRAGWIQRARDATRFLRELRGLTGRLGKALLGTTLRFDYEVRNEADCFKAIPSPRIDKDMVGLAEHILESKAT